MTDDAALLRSYVRDRSEAAFAELVRRHLNLVYFAALRRTGGNAALAEDVAQGVFTALAREAAALTQHPALTGWLYTATRNVALKAIRAEQRRKTREEEAHRMNELSATATSQADWDHLRPLIDAALDELNASDREAVLWRCWDGRAYAEIAGALHITEDAARRRVDRALDKLRARLARRGVTSTSAALAAALGGQAALAAPTGLAASVAGAALATAGTASAGPVAGWLVFMSTSKIGMGAAVLTAILAVGGASYELRASRESTGAADLAQREQAALAGQVEDWRRQAEAGKAGVAAEQAAFDRARAAKSVESEKTGAARAAEARAFTARHPELQAAVRDRVRAEMAGRYRALFVRLKLTPAQIERFLELGAQNASGSADGVEYNMGGDFETMRRELTALLGEEGYEQLNYYAEGWGPAWDLAVRLAGRLYDTPTPLTPEQGQQVFDLIVAHQFPERGQFSMPPCDWAAIMADARAVLAPAQWQMLGIFRAEAEAAQARDQAGRERKQFEQARATGGK